MTPISTLRTPDGTRRRRWEAVLNSGFVPTTPAGSRWQNVLASGFVERREDARALR